MGTDKDAVIWYTEAAGKNRGNEAWHSGAGAKASANRALMKMLRTALRYISE